MHDHQIFISYSKKDKKQMERIFQYLEEKNLKCWFDSRNIPTGGMYSKEIMLAIKSSDVVLLILSQNSQNSKHVINEVDNAFNYDKKIFPIRIDPSELKIEFQYYLSTSQYIDIINNQLEDSLSIISADIKRYLRIPTVTRNASQNQKTPITLAIKENQPVKSYLLGIKGIYYQNPDSIYFFTDTTKNSSQFKRDIEEGGINYYLYKIGSGYIVEKGFIKKIIPEPNGKYFKAVFEERQKFEKPLSIPKWKSANLGIIPLTKADTKMINEEYTQNLQEGKNNAKVYQEQSKIPLGIVYFNMYKEGYSEKIKDYLEGLGYPTYLLEVNEAKKAKLTNFKLLILLYSKEYQRELVEFVEHGVNNGIPFIKVTMPMPKKRTQLQPHREEILLGYITKDITRQLFLLETRGLNIGHEVFLSSNTRDNTISSMLYQKFEDNNIRCWFTPRDFLPTTVSTKDQTNTALVNSKAFILVFSKHTQNSVHNMKELEIAISLNMPIFIFLRDSNNVDQKILEKLEMKNVQKIVFEKRSLSLLIEEVKKVL